MNDELTDEIESVNAIYTQDTLALLSSKPIICALLLPGPHHISLRLEFPDSYPNAPPSILGTQTVGDYVPKGFGTEVVQISRHVLSDIFIPGSACIFDLVEELASRLQQFSLPAAEIESERSGKVQQVGQIHSQQDLDSLVVHDPDAPQSEPLLNREPPWILSETISEKKSVFVARAAHVTSTDEAKSYLHHLLLTDRKAAKATHNMTAWRIHGPGGTAFQDCDDDGETAAGGRLLHLLQLMDVWNVMVVVSRWYGGVQLGPDRFRIINSVARDAVVKAGFVQVEDNGKEHKKKGGKR